jgi:transcriptional regulator with XRE-family HTH domain
MLGMSSNLGVYLKKKRESAGLTQEEVGRALGYASGHQYVSNWERGTSPPPMAKLYELASLYKIAPEELIEVILDEQEKLLRKMLKVKNG